MGMASSLMALEMNYCEIVDISVIKLLYLSYCIVYVFNIIEKAPNPDTYGFTRLREEITQFIEKLKIAPIKYTKSINIFVVEDSNLNLIDYLK
jgi:hypothetical protein